MNGLQKLKLAIAVLFLLMVTAIIGAFIFVTIEESETIDVIEGLSSSDRVVLERFANKLPDYQSYYTILGFMQYAVTGGLFVLLAKLWNLKKI